MNVLIVYIVVFLLTFFVASFAVARDSCCDDPTDPSMVLKVAVFALAWPLTVPTIAACGLLVGIAMLAKKLAGGTK